jgi:hypothetical protein
VGTVDKTTTVLPATVHGLANPALVMGQETAVLRDALTETTTYLFDPVARVVLQSSPDTGIQGFW